MFIVFERLDPESLIFPRPVSYVIFEGELISKHLDGIGAQELLVEQLGENEKVLVLFRNGHKREYTKAELIEQLKMHKAATA